jgi:CheY-like chemotaxis protein
MDEPTSNRFLDPFFSTKAMGRGLGMSAVIGIVRGHKGTMLVDTLPGRGTTISILLPAVAATASSALPPPLPAQARFRGRALVIDDEEQVRTTCSNMLETMGMTCTAVDGGAEAIRLLEHDRDAQFACAVLDLSMPGMDGFETARELKRVRPGLKVILSSGYDEKEAIRRFGQDGPAAFLQKPYSARRLGEVLQRVLG